MSSEIKIEISKTINSIALVILRGAEVWGGGSSVYRRDDGESVRYVVRRQPDYDGRRREDLVFADSYSAARAYVFEAGDCVATVE